MTSNPDWHWEENDEQRRSNETREKKMRKYKKTMWCSNNNG